MNTQKIQLKYLFVLSLLTVSKFLVGTTAIDLISFIKGAQKNFNAVGTAFPLSKYIALSMINDMMPYIKSTETQKIRILEAGAGTGALSQQFVNKLEKLNISYQLDLIEIEPDFSKILNKKFQNNTSVNVYCQDICKFKPEDKYDIIVSTLPFNSKGFNYELVQEIMNSYLDLIKEKGHLFYVEYAFFGKVTKSISNYAQKKDYEKKHKILKEIQEKHNTDQKIIFLNIPPCYIYHLEIKK